MRVRGVDGAALLLVLLGCGERPAPVPALPMNVRPQMAYLRNDLRTVAQALRARRADAALPAARRIENTWLSRKVTGVPAEFTELEKTLRREAGSLTAALRAEDLVAAEEAHQRLRDNCNACHDAYRLGGAVDSLLR